MMDLIIIMPITAALSVVFLLLLKIYLKVREFFPVSVECWFCCKKTKVPFGDANSWDCLSCNQYNGFLEDGDYNRLMPAQYDELLNVPRFTSNAREQHNGMRSSPTLCANCNNNQQMKIAQLAMFMPLNPKNYDLEIEKYSEQLERIYGICCSCEATVTEVFKKQNKLYGLKSPNSERKQPLSKVQPVIAVKRPLLFTHYATLLLGAVLFYSSTRNSSQFVSLENFIIDQLHKFMKLLPNSAFLEERLKFITLLMANNVYRFYTWIPSSLADRLTYSMDHFIIGALILISVLELSRVRNTISLLNTGTWIILLSLNVSSTAPQYLISLMQAMVSVVFIYISIGSLRMERKIRMKTKMRKGKMKKHVPKKSNETIKTNAPSCSTVDNSKMKITRDNEPLISKPTTAKSASSVHSAKMLNNPLKDSSKPSRSHIEFGLSDLSLGPSSESGSIRNHLNSEPRPYCGRLNDQIWSRSTVLSPSRLNMDTVDSPFTTSASPPRSQRSLNESSGRGSIVSNQESVCGERIYDKFSPNNKLTVANQPLTHQNYYDLYPSSEFSYPAMTHYQFTSQLQRRYSSSPPNSTIFLNNSPPSNSMLPYMPLPFYPSFHQFQSTPTHPPTDAHSKNSFFHSIVFPALVVVLVACNLSLLGLVYYREISMKNT